MTKRQSIDQIRDRFDDGFDIGASSFGSDMEVAPDDNSTKHPVPPYLQKKIAERVSAFEPNGQIEPGAIVWVRSDELRDSSKSARTEEMLAVLLDVQTQHNQAWKGWLVTHDLTYASCWDLVLGSEDDPRDPLCQIVQAWNPLTVNRSAISGTLGKLSSYRLACVRQLAHDFEVNDKDVDVDDHRPGVILARTLRDGTGVVTGTPLTADDARLEYQSIYRNVANALTRATQRHTQVNSKPSITKRWSALIAMITMAIAFGAITMRFAMMSGMEAVRSGNTITTVDGSKKFAQSVSVLVTYPMETVGSTVAEAVRLQLTFSVKVVTGGYDVLIEGLVPNSFEQSMLKKTLGISTSAGGDLLFQIRQKATK